MGLVECEHDERPSWAFVRFQDAMFIYQATELLACLFQALAFENVPAMDRFIFWDN